MICGVVLVKSVKIVFTLKQFDFSFLDETAVVIESLVSGAETRKDVLHSKTGSKYLKWPNTKN